MKRVAKSLFAAVSFSFSILDKTPKMLKKKKKKRDLPVERLV